MRRSVNTPRALSGSLRFATLTFATLLLPALIGPPLAGPLLTGPLLGPATAHAFTVQSGFTSACHERISIASYLIGRSGIDPFPEEELPDGEWEEIFEYLFPDVLDLSRSDRFLLFSIIVGARAPDSEGFSLTNLAVLRSVQSDPAGQYVHCLRGADDDYDVGNDSALAGCRDAIRNEVRTAFMEREEEELIEVPLTLDNYGTIEVDVIPAAYHLGRALHTLQDGFTHTLRDPELRSVVHVMNYEAAIANELVEERDGMAHSAAVDSCVTVGGVTGELVNRGRVFGAVEAGADLVQAFIRGVTRELPPDAFLTEVDAVLLKWFRQADPQEFGFEVCEMNNDYCSSPWLRAARISPATPVLSCSAVPNRGRIPRILSLVSLALLLRLGSRTLGSRTLGSRTLGSRTLSSRTLGSRTLGSRTLGRRR